MSGGRAELGLGAGWFDAEHLAYGIPFVSTKERFERLAEQLEIIWDCGGPDRFDLVRSTGQHYQLKDSPGLPKPVELPAPPIIVGVSVRSARRSSQPDSRRSTTRPSSTLQMPPSNSAWFARRVTRGRAILTISSIRVASTICCGADASEVARRAKKIGRPVEELETYATAGTPAQVVDRLHEFGNAGAEVVYLQFLDMNDLDHIRLLGDEVLPHIF